MQSKELVLVQNEDKLHRLHRLLSPFLSATCWCCGISPGRVRCLKEVKEVKSDD